MSALPYLGSSCFACIPLVQPFVDPKVVVTLFSGRTRGEFARVVPLPLLDVVSLSSASMMWEDEASLLFSITLSKAPRNELLNSKSSSNLKESAPGELGKSDVKSCFPDRDVRVLVVT